MTLTFLASTLMFWLRRFKERLFTYSLPMVHDMTLNGLSLRSESFRT